MTVFCSDDVCWISGLRAYVFDLNAINSFYWRPEFKLRSQNWCVNVSTYSSDDDDGMEEEKRSQVIGRTPNFPAKEYIDKCRERIEWKWNQLCMCVCTCTGIFAAESFWIFLAGKLCSWQIYNWLLIQTHTNAHIYVPTIPTYIHMHNIESLF